MVHTAQDPAWSLVKVTNEPVVQALIGPSSIVDLNSIEIRSYTYRDDRSVRVFLDVLKVTVA